MPNKVYNEAYWACSLDSFNRNKLTWHQMSTTPEDLVLWDAMNEPDMFVIKIWIDEFGSHNLESVYPDRFESKQEFVDRLKNLQ